MPPAVDNINNLFFRGAYKDVWKKLIHPSLTKAECDLLVDQIQPASTDKILDLMCGYGRHSLELAARGIAVRAIDNEEAYVEELKREAEEKGLAVEAYAGDVLEADFGTGFKAAVCMGNSFAFFNKEEALKLLKLTSKALADNGIFIIGSWMVAEIAFRHFREKEWREVDEYKYLLSHTYHPIPSRIESEHTIISNDGSVEVIQGVEHIYSFTELEMMFNEAGFKTRSLFSTPRKKSFSLGDPAVYIVAEKV
jgi:SAM-dependent methyltransferase